MSGSTPGALERIAKAMVLVEQAQGLLDQAAQQLSSVRYASDLGDKTFALREKCHAHWYVLRKASQTRKRMSLDSEPEIPARAPKTYRADEERRIADKIDGYDRDDLGPSEDR